MKKTKHLLTAALCSLLLLALILTAPKAHAEYRDGTYQVAISLGGSGMNHNELLSPTTVRIENGSIYVDLVFHRVTNDHAPQYVSVTTGCGTFTGPSISDTAMTCAFYGVEVPSLGDVSITTVTEAMSQPYEVDYTVHIDDADIPQTGGSSAPASGDTQSTTAAQSGTTAAQSGSTDAPAPQVTLPDKPTQALPGDVIEPETPDGLLIAPAPGGAPEEAAAEAPAAETAPAESPDRSAVLYAVIAIVALAAIVGVTLGFRRGKKKGE
jgi:hypothetical protein